MNFWRIYNDNLYATANVDKLGWPLIDPYYIPDEYLKQKIFTVFRASWGIGDWGIISAMPRILKKAYPNCKVYIPSSKMIKRLFNVDTNVTEIIFKNNPWIDAFKDHILGEIFHDHYRLYSTDDLNIPLLVQMLNFWQFKDLNWLDLRPEIYWSDEEKKLGDSIIYEFTKGADFGTLLLSERFGTQCGKFDKKTFEFEHKTLTKLINENPLFYFYWSYKPLLDIPFKINGPVLDLRNVDLRIQLYIRSKGKICIGNQSGLLQSISRYTNLHMTQRQVPIKHNYIEGEQYYADA